MKLAVKCVKIAALSFADQEKESAADIAEAAVQSCRRHVLAAASAASKDAAAKGKPVRKSAAEKIVVDALVDGAKSFVIEMRGIARRSGPNFYREAAQRIASSQ